jgi:sulfur oxidation c-type cytochrome SoxX
LTHHLESFLPSHLAREIARQDPSGESLGRTDTGAIMAVRVSGLQRWSAGVGSLRALALVHAITSLAESHARRQGGMLEHVQGDTLLLSWSTPPPESAHAPQGMTIHDKGEKLAQNGRGMTWTDASAAPKANGGGCYNCHQISKAEISFGTIGPSLYQYGKLRGVTDPADAAAKPIVDYTWAKLWNAKAFNACSGMPRFGHGGLLDEAQLKHLMALILDPKSPVNQ